MSLSGALPHAVIDLFGGPGGWDVGAHALGLDPLGIEDDPYVIATRTAAGLCSLMADVRTLDPADFAPLAGLLGSPVCSTFSKAGPGSGFRSRDDVIACLPRVTAGADPAGFGLDPVTALVLEPLRFITVTRPRFVALEQVPAVLPVWRAYARELETLGYRSAVGIVSAETLGVPQTRRRAFLLAALDHQPVFPAPTHRAYRKGVPRGAGDPALIPWVSMADAIGWGMTARPYLTLAPGGTPISGADAMLLGGGHARQLVKDEWLAGRWRLKSQHGVPRNTRPVAEPGFTVTSHVGRNFLQHQPDPPDGDWYNVRRVGLSEAAVLQSFPHDYPFDISGGITRAYGQVGSAVPPRVAAQLLASLLRRRLPPALLDRLAPPDPALLSHAPMLASVTSQPR